MGRKLLLSLCVGLQGVEAQRDQSVVGMAGVLNYFPGFVTLS